MTSLKGRFGKIEHASLLNHHPAAQRKADTAATPFGGEERHEERLTVLCGNGKTVVADIK